MKHGLTGAGVVLPADEEAEVAAVRASLVAEFQPADDETRELIDRTALAKVRRDRAARMESARRIQAAARALSGWRDDRRAAAEELATRLARRPSLVARQLRRTLQGCELLLDRWRGLLRVAESGHAWDEAARARALDLLGVPVEDRTHHPRLHDKATAEELAALAREEVEHLEGCRDGYLEDLDEDERLLAETGLAFDDSTAGRRLWGYERANERTYFRGLDELRRRRGRGLAPPVDRPRPTSRPSVVAGTPRVPSAETQKDEDIDDLMRIAPASAAAPAPPPTIATLPRPTPPTVPVGNRRQRRAQQALARRRG